MNQQSPRKTWVVVSLLAILGLSLGAVDSAWAQGGWGCMNANLTPEQKAAFLAVMERRMAIAPDNKGRRGPRWKKDIGEGRPGLPGHEPPFK